MRDPGAAGRGRIVVDNIVGVADAAGSVHMVRAVTNAVRIRIDEPGGELFCR